MSHKKSKSQRHMEQQRKRESRAHRAAAGHRGRGDAANGGESYFADDDTYHNFTRQLHVLGLALREIPGDGNCLFRALADQYDGSSQKHVYYRQETVDYMITHRDDFEPFIEDNMPFDRYVAQLRKPGTYAGNDAIVAFARNHQCNIVIHQLDAPIYQIIGCEHPYARELHISYHNGDHYASIRRIGDVSHCAANIKFMQSPPAVVANGEVLPVNGCDAGAIATSGKHKKGGGSSNKGGASSSKGSASSSKGVGVSSKGGSGSVSSDATTIYPDESTGEVKAVRDMQDVERFIMDECGNQDVEEVRQALVDNLYDVDSTVAYLLQLEALRCGGSNNNNASASQQPASSSPQGESTADSESTSPASVSDDSAVETTRIAELDSITTSHTAEVGGTQAAVTPPTVSGRRRVEADRWSRASSGYSSLSAHSSCTAPAPTAPTAANPAATGARPKVKCKPPHQVSNRQRKALARQDKKRRHDERHKQAAAADVEGSAEGGHDTVPPLMLEDKLRCLNI